MERKYKWTAIDTLIVIVVAAVVAAAAYVLGPKFFKKTDNEKVEFTVLMSEKEPEYGDAVKVGDNVTISFTEKDGGVVKDVKVEQAKKQAYNSINGTYSMEPVENKVDVYVTIEADCTSSDTAIKTGDTAIKVGTEIPVQGKGYAATGYIITINEEE